MSGLHGPLTRSRPYGARKHPTIFFAFLRGRNRPDARLVLSRLRPLSAARGDSIGDHKSIKNVYRAAWRRQFASSVLLHKCLRYDFARALPHTPLGPVGTPDFLGTLQIVLKHGPQIACEANVGHAHYKLIVELTASIIHVRRTHH